MRDHEIPFSSEDLATIGQTAMWMRIAGGIMLGLGVVALIGQREVWSVIAMLPWLAVATALIVVLAPIVVGGLMLLAASGFRQVSIQPSVAPLARGLRAMTILYVLQAIALLAMVLFFVWALL